jgi:hypothetical protein
VAFAPNRAWNQSKPTSPSSAERLGCLVALLVRGPQCTAALHHCPPAGLLPSDGLLVAGHEPELLLWSGLWLELLLGSGLRLELLLGSWLRCLGVGTG